MSRVVVLGAGMGGLAASIALAGRGHDVTVLERSGRAGGKAGIAEIDGVEVDTGPSVLTLPGVFEEVMRRAGTTLAEHANILLPEPASRYVYPDGLVLDVFSDRDRTVEAVREALGAGAAGEMASFLDYSRRIWDAAAPWFVYGAAPTPGHVLGLGPRAWAAVPRIDAFRSMDRAIDQRVRTPQLRWLLRRYATYNGSDPRTAPATLNCITHVELGLGVHAVEGGIHALVRALQRVAEQAGVEFRFQAEASALRTEGGRVTGIELSDGALVDAHAVVVNADVAHLVHDLLPAESRHGLRGDPTPSMSGWVGILRARRRADRVGHTVLFPDDYTEEFVDIFDRDRPPAEPTLYLCAQERCHRRTGWPDAEPVFVMANAPAEPAGGSREEAIWARLEETALHRLRSSGLMDADDTLVWKRTPTGLARAFPGSRGSIYGAASNDLFAAFRRPPNRVRRLPGLYLASGGAHPGGGMPLCALSGLAAADAFEADQG